MNLRDKIHKFFFNSYEIRLESLKSLLGEFRKRNEDNNETVIRLGEAIKKANEDIEKLKTIRDKYFEELKQLKLKFIELENAPKPTMEELMRQNIGGEKISFASADSKTGYIPHFMDINDKDTQTKYVTQLYQISQMEVWNAMVKFFIDDVANVGFRSADEKQITIARATINGVCLLRNQVQLALEEWQETTKKEESFDPYEAGSGIT